VTKIITFSLRDDIAAELVAALCWRYGYVPREGASPEEVAEEAKEFAKQAYVELGKDVIKQYRTMLGQAAVAANVQTSIATDITPETVQVSIQ